MHLIEEFFGLTLFDIRRAMADKAKCKAHDTIPAAHMYKKKLNELGKTNDERLSAALLATGLPESVTAEDLLTGLISLWWGDLAPLITPYDRAAHETHPRKLPIRRSYKKAKEYWAKYKFSKLAEFESVQKKFKCKDVKFPYLTVVGTIFDIQLANNTISEWPLKSNVFEIDDEGKMDELGEID